MANSKWHKRKHLNLSFKQQMLSCHLLTDELRLKRFGQTPNETVYPLTFPALFEMFGL